MDIALNPSNSTSMSSMLSRSVEESNSQQEEQRTVPVTTASSINNTPPHVTKNTHLMVINPKENCSELVRLSQVCPSKYMKVIAKADTTNGSEMQGANRSEKTSRESNTVPCENDKDVLFR